MRDQTGRVYQELKQRILDGFFKPSESLVEVSLASELKVSRNTIRKALLKLESENLIVIEENGRSRVRYFTAEEVMEYLEVRELLEGFVIKKAIAHLKDSDIDEMRAIFRDMEECIEKGDLILYSQNNWRFHDIIYRACPNRPAVELITMIKNQLKRYNIKTILVKGRGEDSLEEHRRILSAIEKKDGNMAELELMRHIANLRDVLQKHFELLQ
ncbi:MAG: GntR family transcriptional regulator [Syntrophorhabdaceae bacterium]|nr:GntR family transcriptional regulator [Syntrophorhabdaceae bacterium]